MNTRLKIAMGIAGGALIGATVLGAAFASPATTGQPFYGGMMSGISRAATGATGTAYADMQQFMQQYRTSNGGVDVNRMHSDVASGKVTPPCVNGRSSATGTGVQGSGTSGGYGMMGYRR